MYSTAAGPSWVDNNIVDSPNINGGINFIRNPFTLKQIEYVLGGEEGNTVVQPR